MYKLWARKIKNNRIINSIVVKNKDNISLDEKRKKCMDEICKKLDLSIPVWLKKHDIEFSQFKYVVLYPEDFIDEIDFDKLEIELIDDGNDKNKNWTCLLQAGSIFILHNRNYYIILPTTGRTKAMYLIQYHSHFGTQ